MNQPPTDTAGGTDIGRHIWGAVKQVLDPRMRWFHQLAFLVSLVLVPIALLRLKSFDWGDALIMGWYDVFVVGWFCLVTYAVRTVGARELIRFWLLGFFTVVLLTYLVTMPIGALLGPGNAKSAIWVPIVEEIVKVLPLLAWTTFLRPRHRHGTLSDFWLMGFVIGAGFSFHEDLLYGRQMAAGFSDGAFGFLFPQLVHSGGGIGVGHAGWTALAGVGVGFFSLYRHSKWNWLLGAVLLALVIFDHGAWNWEGSDLPRSLMLDGYLVAILTIASVAIVVIHDFAVLRWAGGRDETFIRPDVRGDAAALRAGNIELAVGRLLWRQRYRRLRNAAFVDLYAVRRRGESAGDRNATIGHLVSTAQFAHIPIGRQRAKVLPVPDPELTCPVAPRRHG